MNKTDITGILTGIELSDAQIKALLDVNSADITKALNKQKDDLTAAKQALMNNKCRAIQIFLHGLVAQ